jgi:hypothetical protein
MTVIFTHLIPGNPVGRQTPVNQVQGCYVLDDVNRGIYAQKSAAPTPAVLVGGVPCLSDGVGGISQFARELDVRYCNQRTGGFSGSMNGSTLTANYPQVKLFWDGAVQTLPAGSTQAAVSNGTWSLVISYGWGLSQPTIVQTSTFDMTGNSIELCRYIISGTTVTARPATVESKWMGTVLIAYKQDANSVPVSDSSGNMPY